MKRISQFQPLLAHQRAAQPSRRGTSSITRHLYLALVFATGVMMFPSLAPAAAAKGWFGITISIDAEGTPLNATLQTIKVQSVAPASPAASAGLASGDLVLEIEGIAVAGAKAETIESAMRKAVGESLRLKVKHGTHTPHDVVLTAIAKPPK
jgi:predicted metalloprotease with PDZ domain